MLTVQQFLARYPQPVPDSEHERVQAALEDAEIAVRVEAGLSTDAPLPAALEPIVLRVAIRTFANPLGISSETIGDYTWRADNRPVGTVLSPDERAEIARVMGHGGVVSVPIRQHWTASDRSRLSAYGPPPPERRRGDEVPWWR